MTSNMALMVPVNRRAAVRIADAAPQRIAIFCGFSFWLAWFMHSH